MDYLESLLQGLDPRQLLRQLETQEEITDPELWITRRVIIEDRGGEAAGVPFTLWPAQRQALRDLRSHRFCIAMKSRQVGFSWLVLADALHLIWSRPGSSVLLVSLNDMAAKEAIRRAVFMLRHMPAWMMGEGAKAAALPVWDSTTSSVQIHHPNGETSTLTSFPAGPNAGRGFTADLVVVDEAASQQWAEEIYASQLPTISRAGGNGRIVMLSTNVRGSLFEKLWMDSRSGANDFHRIFIPWSGDPRRDQSWYDRMARQLGPVVAQEFPSTEEEALSTPGGAFFHELRANTHLIQPREIPRWWRRYVGLDYGFDSLSAVWLALDEAGHGIIYRELEISDLTYSQAAGALLDACRGETITAWYAPPDLWARSRESGRTAAELFAQGGVYFTRSSSNREHGWGLVREWLLPRTVTDDEGRQQLIPNLQVFDSCTRLWHCMTSIQRSKRDPNDCSTEPHSITHLPDALRYVLVSRTRPSAAPDPEAEEKPSTYRQAVRALTGGGKPSKSYMRWS